MSNQQSEIRSPLIASWIILIFTMVVAVIPVFGFLAWIIGTFTILAAFVLGIVIITKGGTWNGILVLFMAVIVTPLFIALAPVVTTVLMGATVEALDPSTDVGIEVIEETSVDSAMSAESAAEAVPFEAVPDDQPEPD